MPICNVSCQDAFYRSSVQVDKNLAGEFLLFNVSFRKRQFANTDFDLPEMTLKQHWLVKDLSTECAPCQTITRSQTGCRDSSHSATRALARSGTNASWGQGSVQAGQFLLHQTISLWALCTLPHGVRIYGLSVLRRVVTVSEAHKHTIPHFYLNMAFVDVFWEWNILLISIPKHFGGFITWWILWKKSASYPRHICFICTQILHE